MTMSHQVIKRLWLSHGVFSLCVSVLDSSVPRGASCHIMRQHCEDARVSKFRSRSSGTCQKLNEWAWNQILSQSSLEKTAVSWETLTHTQPSYLQILSSQKFSSVQFIHSVMSDSLQPHGLQHVRLPCPSPTPRADSNSCPLSWWCHPTILSSVIPFSSCLQSFSASRSFPMNQFFTSGGQTPKYWSFSFSINPSNELFRTSFRVDWFGLVAVQGTLKSLLQHHTSKASIVWCSAFFTVQLSHLHMTTGKTIALTRWAFVGKVMSLFFSVLSRWS